MGFKIKVFPHTRSGNEVVKWNAVVYTVELLGLIYQCRTPGVPDPEIARMQAQALVESGQWRRAH